MPALVALAACSEVVEENYNGRTDAEKAGAIERGWIPPFVPPSARDIHDVHDLDTNAQRLAFTVPAAEIESMVASITPKTKLAGPVAQRLFDEVGWNRDESRGAEAYLLCTRSYSGALAVNRTSERAVYISPVEWAREDCPRPL